MLDAQATLGLWEAGSRQGLLGRGILLLAALSPATPADALADVPLGDRNRVLLTWLRRSGPNLASQAVCHGCGVELEIVADLDALLSLDPGDGPRLTSRDLAEALALSREDARSLLRSRVGEPEQAEAADPLAAITIESICGECGTVQSFALDPVRFAWARIESRAVSLLREVDALARAYGWTEAEVLSVPAGRRQLYLRLVGAG